MKTKGLRVIKGAIGRLIASGSLRCAVSAAWRALLCCGACAGIAFFPFFTATASVSYASEMKFQENLQAFKRGDYKNAMLGFMDIVIEDPKNDLAGKYLRESGLKVLEIENGNIQRRREELLRGAKMMKKQLDSLEKVKEEKILEWDKVFLRVKKLAEDPDSLRKVFPAYADFVGKTPIYAGKQTELYEKEQIIREILVKTVKKSAPDIVIIGTGVDDASLAGMFASRFVLKGVLAESVLAELLRIKDMRGRISALFEYETRALDLYGRGRVEEADVLFRRVLKVDTGNVEAAFYSNIASERLTASSFPGTPLPAVRAPAASACINDLCPKTDMIDARAGVVTDQRPARGAVASMPAGLPEKTLVESSSGAEDVADVASEAPGRQASGTASASAPNQRPRETGSPVKRTVAEKGARPRGSADAITEAYGYQMSASISEAPVESGQVGSAVSADKLYEQGVREFSVGNYGAAAIIWKECLRIDPGHKKAKLGIKRLESVVVDQ